MDIHSAIMDIHTDIYAWLSIYARIYGELYMNIHIASTDIHVVVH